MLRPGAFSIPLAPLALTLSGLIPFLGSAAMIVASGDDPIGRAQATFVLIAYGATILSFLGGVRWGIEMTRTPQATRAMVMAGSVVGALVGWPILLVAVLNPGFSTAKLCLALAAALVAHWLWDVLGRAALPAWYDGLRMIATAGAAGSLLVAWAFLSG